MAACEACQPELLPPTRVVLCDCPEDCGATGCDGRLRAAVKVIAAGQCPAAAHHGPLRTGWAAGWCGHCGGAWEITVRGSREGVSFLSGWAVAIGAPPEVPGE